MSPGGAAAYGVLVDLEKAKHPSWSLSRCHDEVRKSATGAQALAGSLCVQQAGQQRRKQGHGRDQRSLEGAGEHESGDAALSRLRAAHGRKMLDKFNSVVDADVAGGMRRSDAQMKAMRDHPELFQSAKEARLPLSDDGNSLRA